MYPVGPGVLQGLDGGMGGVPVAVLIECHCVQKRVRDVSHVVYPDPLLDRPFLSRLYGQEALWFCCPIFKTAL